MTTPPVDLSPPPPGSITREKAWQAEVRRAAAHYGWFCFHMRNAIANETLCDLACWRGEDESLLIELKVGRNPVTAVQRRMIQTLSAYGKTVHVLKPEDWAALIALLRGKA